NLDQIAAFLVTLAHRLACFVGAIDDAFLRSGIFEITRRETIGWIGVAARGGERFSRGENARADDRAVSDCLAKRDCDPIAIAEVTDRGEAGKEMAVRG